MITKGSQVEIKGTLHEGEVIAKRYNEAEDEFDFHVEFDDGEGESQSRWFKESELNVTKLAPPEAKKQAPPPDAPAKAAPKKATSKKR